VTNDGDRRRQTALHARTILADPNPLQSLLKDSPTEEHEHLLLVLEALTNGETLGCIRSTLNRVANLSSDEQLRIYLAPVRGVLASTVLENMPEGSRVDLPLERAPYSTLLAYCRRRMGR
jgi:hypothetical protein